jgi:hypothetical protein
VSDESYSQNTNYVFKEEKNNAYERGDPNIVLTGTEYKHTTLRTKTLEGDSLLDNT